MSRAGFGSGQGSIKITRMQGGLHVIDDELNKIPLEDDSVDLIHSSGVLHHVRNLSLAFEEIKRVMKVGGGCR